MRTPRRARRERGAALLVVLVSVAFVTAVAVDLAYQSRVALQVAGNGRDTLRAEAAARGGVALARLVLRFQARLDDVGGATAGLNLPGLGAGQGLAALAPGASLPRPQIWKLVPVSSSLAANLFGGGGGDGAPAAEAARSLFEEGTAATGDGFLAAIEDEDRKVNVQLDALAQGGLQGGQLEAFLQLVSDRSLDFLFEGEDETGPRPARPDLAIRLKDWVDEDPNQSALTGLAERPFETGFGDENSLYDRGPDRYKAKNARFDSLDELFLVAGVSDEFMAAFGDRLTVYPSRSSRMNVNADTREELLRNARIMADPPVQPIFSDLSLGERLERAVMEARLGGFIAISPIQFAQLLETLNVSVHPDYTNPRNVDRRGAFTDRSAVFRVRCTATAGRVERLAEAVVTFAQDQGGQQAAGLGRLLHWREE